MLRSIRLETRVNNALVGEGTPRVVTVFRDSRDVTSIRIEAGAGGSLDLAQAMEVLGEGYAGINVKLTGKDFDEIETGLDRLDKLLHKAKHPVDSFIFKPSGLGCAHLDTDILTVKGVTVTAYAGSMILATATDVTIQINAAGDIKLN